MSDQMHTIVAVIILILLWNLFLKHLYYTEKDWQRWQEIVDKFFYK